jgi:hypothetical protein
MQLCNVGWAKSAALEWVNKGWATSEGGSSVQMECRAGSYSQEEGCRVKLMEGGLSTGGHSNCRHAEIRCL